MFLKMLMSVVSLKNLIPSLWFRFCKSTNTSSDCDALDLGTILWETLQSFPLRLQHSLYSTCEVVLETMKQWTHPFRTGLGTQMSWKWYGLRGLCCGRVWSGRRGRRREERWGLKANVCSRGFQATDKTVEDTYPSLSCSHGKLTQELKMLIYEEMNCLSLL